VFRRLLIPGVLFVAAFLTAALQFPSVRLGGGFETLTIARNLAAHGEFSNPFSPRVTGPTAHTAPLYPAFLALLLWIFGNTPAFALTLDGITIAIHALHAALLPAVSELFFNQRRPGIFAAGISILLPVFFLFPQYEIMFVATGLMLFCLVTARLLQWGRVAATASGIGIGLLALLNPASIVVAAVWLVYLLWRRRPARPVRFLALAALAAAVTLAPWTYRNYQQFHSLFFIRDNLGLELYIANNDLAQASFALNEASGEHRRLHPGSSEAEARQYAALGELAYYHRCGALAAAWIRQHPARFAALTATRIRMFWFPDADDTPWHSYSVAAVTVLAAFGLALLARRREPIALFFAGALLLYPLLYYCVQSDPRYRTPILWIPLLAGGYFLSLLARAGGPAGTGGRITRSGRRGSAAQAIAPPAALPQSGGHRAGSASDP
jgi:hypothetical protein